MLKIAHRINTLEQLREVPADQGIELDIRSYGNDLVLHHDAFVEGTLFRDLLKEFKHAFIILNVKAEGLEDTILALLAEFSITRYFFLDLSLPFLVKYANRGERNIAVRFSKYEPLEFIAKFNGLVDWVWVDCFDGEFLITDETYMALKSMFKICVVSPELQGQSIEKIAEFRAIIGDKDIDAVCTKRPDLW